MDTTAFVIGDIEIKWYAIIIVCGMIIALGLFVYLCRKHSEVTDPVNPLYKTYSLNGEFCLAMFVFAVVFAVIGARLIFWLPRIKTVDFFDFRNGGLTIIGAIPFGALGICLCCYWYKKSPIRVIDLVVPCMLLGQVIGRWGNFVNGELYGAEITAEWLQFFPMAVNINGVWHAANFFYEMVLNLIGMCIALFILHRYGEKLKPGFLTICYLMWYGIVRGSLEFLKEDPHRWGNVKAVQLICFIVVPIAIIALVLLQYGKIKFETDKMRRMHFMIPNTPPEYAFAGEASKNGGIESGAANDSFKENSAPDIGHQDDYSDLKTQTEISADEIGGAIVDDDSDIKS